MYFASCCSFSLLFPPYLQGPRRAVNIRSNRKEMHLALYEPFHPIDMILISPEPFSETPLVFPDNHRGKSIDCSLKNLKYPIKECVYYVFLAFPFCQGALAHSLLAIQATGHCFSFL